MNEWETFRGFLFRTMWHKGIEYWEVLDRWPEAFANKMIFEVDKYNRNDCIEIFKNQPDYLYGEPDRFKWNI